jgi:hypothetical protein
MLNEDIDDVLELGRSMCGSQHQWSLWRRKASKFIWSSSLATVSYERGAKHDFPNSLPVGWGVSVYPADLYPWTPLSRVKMITDWVSSPRRDAAAQAVVEMRATIAQNPLMIYSNPEMYQDLLNQATSNIAGLAEKLQHEMSQETFNALHSWSSNSLESEQPIDLHLVGEAVRSNSCRGDMTAEQRFCLFLSFLVYLFHSPKSLQSHSYHRLWHRDSHGHRAARSIDNPRVRMATPLGLERYEYPEVCRWLDQDWASSWWNRRLTFVVAVPILLLALYGFGLAAYITLRTISAPTTGEIFAVTLLTVGLGFYSVVQVSTVTIRLLQLLQQSEQVRDLLYSAYSKHRARILAPILNALELLAATPYVRLPDCHHQQPPSQPAAIVPVFHGDIDGPQHASNRKTDTSEVAVERRESIV